MGQALCQFRGQIRSAQAAELPGMRRFFHLAGEMIDQYTSSFN
jgi:hypothetical protein